MKHDHVIIECACGERREAKAAATVTSTVLQAAGCLECMSTLPGPDYLQREVRWVREDGRVVGVLWRMASTGVGQWVEGLIGRARGSFDDGGCGDPECCGRDFSATLDALAIYDEAAASFAERVDAADGNDAVLALFDELESLARAVGEAYGADTWDINDAETCAQCVRPGPWLRRMVGAEVDPCAT